MSTGKPLQSVCMFGTYFADYVRNTTIRDGLLESGIVVREIHRTIPKEKIESPNDITVFHIVRRIITRGWVNLKLLSQWRTVKMSDVIIVPYPGHLSLPFAWLLAKIFRKPLIFDALITLYDGFVIEKGFTSQSTLKARGIKFIESFLFRLPDKLLVDTNENLMFVANTFGIPTERISCVPIGANNHLYRQSTHPFKENNPVDVLFFGLYNPLQGTQIIMQAARLLKDEPCIRITMLGKGPLMQNALRFAEENGLHNVVFTGFVPGQALVQRIQQCDIMLGIFSDIPTGLRAIPNKVFAGIACAKPVITSDSIAIREYFTHDKDIWLCAPNDAKKLANTIKILANNKQLRERIAHGGFQLYQNRFTQSHIGHEIKKLFEALKNN